MALILIGYWRWLGSRDLYDPSDAELPDPRQLVDPSWDPDVKRQVVGYLRQGKVAAAYMGWSCCRFGCGVRDSTMGTTELTDGVWVWPQGLPHYVDVHSVRLPSDFMSHARQRRFEIPSHLVDDYLGNPDYDLSFWITWAREQGASTQSTPVPPGRKAATKQ